MNRIIVGLGLIIIVVLALGMLHKQAHHRLDKKVKNHISRGGLFDVIDTNDDDKVEIRELFFFIRTNHKLLDLNKDGGVDKEELKNFRTLLKNDQ